MKREHSLVVALTVAAGTAILVGSLAHRGTGGPTERGRLHLTALQRWLVTRSQQGRFILKGMVVDDAGSPLDDVELQIGKDTAPALIFDKLRSSREERKINREFSLDLRGHVGVHLTFTKEGYYSEELDFGIRAVEDNHGPGQHPLVRAESLRVVLLKQDAPTTLITYRGKLKCSADGCGEVVNIRDILQSKAVTRSVKVSTKQEALRYGDLYMMVARNKEGGLQTVQKSITQYFKAMVPVETTLAIDGGGSSGFTDPVKAVPDPLNRQLRMMRAAPENGYGRVLTLAADLFPLGGAPRFGIYFFLRAVNVYGKGCLEFARVEGDTVSVSLSLFLQPDGSRNLEDPTAY